jgi:protein-tyrosine phosphatase
LPSIRRETFVTFRQNATELVAGPMAGANQTSVLFVCTANQCRSPFAEAIAGRYADNRHVEIGSAGLIQRGQRVPPNGLLVASELGLDLADHVSRQADVHGLRDWDLILTMAREHVRELVAADSTRWTRVFTIKQFRRWIEENPQPRATALGEWIDSAAADRSRFYIVGASPHDDIDDPVRSPPEAWRTMAEAMDEELAAIFSRLSRSGKRHAVS